MSPPKNYTYDAHAADYFTIHNTHVNAGTNIFYEDLRIKSILFIRIYSGHFSFGCSSTILFLWGDRWQYIKIYIQAHTQTHARMHSNSSLSCSLFTRGSFYIVCLCIFSTLLKYLIFKLFEMNLRLHVKKNSWFSSNDWETKELVLVGMRYL